MKVGDLVKYNRTTRIDSGGAIYYTYNNNFNEAKACPAVILYINEDGGTVKALLPSGETGWLVKSGCEVISESR